VSSHGIDWSTKVGQQIYVWYASLLHLPIALINQARRPAAAAVVAAPILKYYWHRGGGHNQHFGEDVQLVCKLLSGQRVEAAST